VLCVDAFRRVENAISDFHKDAKTKLIRP
jgi:hypothetical protein